MPNATLRFIVRTPHEVTFDAPITSARLLTETGQVGLRGRMESIVIPVEPGLLVVRAKGAVTFIGSAGGVLASDGRQATLFTPLAVVGNEAVTVQQAIDRALAEPDSEMAARVTFGKLEGRILTQLRRRPGEPPILTGESR
jgi:F0F1-type ATP synthase epsilon subunit